MKVFLYMCERCGTAKFNSIDSGEQWYSSCGGCREMTFHCWVRLNCIHLFFNAKVGD